MFWSRKIGRGDWLEEHLSHRKEKSVNIPFM
jgi:hypothetical protein